MHISLIEMQKIEISVLQIQIFAFQLEISLFQLQIYAFQLEISVLTKITVSVFIYRDICI